MDKIVRRVVARILRDADQEMRIEGDLCWRLQ
jgi:hypothetical protein